MILRPYQDEAVEAVYQHLRTHDDNPCAVIPTAGGKTPVIATICRDAVQRWGGRVLILAHVKELLEQAAEKLRAIAPDVPVGVYSAGLRRRDLGYAVTIAGIQSVYQKACDVGPVDLVIVCSSRHEVRVGGLAGDMRRESALVDVPTAKGGLLAARTRHGGHGAAPRGSWRPSWPARREAA